MKNQEIRTLIKAAKILLSTIETNLTKEWDQPVFIKIDLGKESDRLITIKEYLECYTSENYTSGQKSWFGRKLLKEAGKEGAEVKYNGKQYLYPFHMVESFINEYKQK